MAGNTATKNVLDEAKPMHPAKKAFMLFCVLVILLVSSFFLWVSNHYVAPIMMYHHVGYGDKSLAAFVSPEAFGKQMRYLYDHNYRVISLDQLVHAIQDERKISRKSVVITFDDGFEDNYTHAFKILQKYDFTATFFLPSDYINEEGQMSWDQVKEMMAKGMMFGSHTRRHAYLPDQSLDVQRDEIINSKKILEEKLDTKINLFAYPIGGFNQQIKDIVEEAGYTAACTTNRGYDRSNRDLYELNRIKFGESDVRFANMWIKLSGYYNVLRTLKSSY